MAFMFGKICIFVTLLTIVCAQDWIVGNSLTYDIKTTVLLGENSLYQARNGTAGDVGFQLTAKLNVLPLWKDPKNSETFLISIKTLSPQLWIKSRKAPEPEGFVEHSSRLDDIPKEPILFLWRNGQIIKTFAVSTESLSSLNLKRGLVSIFQYRTIEGESEETDASGTCNVTYSSLKPRTFEKIKEVCAKNKKQQSNPILGVKVNSFSKTKYYLTEASLPKEVEEDERYEMSLVARPEASSVVKTNRILRLVSGITKEKPIIASTYTEVINKIDARYVEVSIEAQNEHVACPESGCVTLENVIDSSRSALEASAIGTPKLASAFLKIVPLIRDASTENLAKILKSPRYREIQPQLYDLYGSASTFAAHQAAMKVLRQDETGDDTERYLWALSTSPYPDPQVIKDVLKRSEETMQNDKLSETFALAAAAMAKRYGVPSMTEIVKQSLELGLYSCTGEPCKTKFLRALGNLNSKSVLPILVNHATNNSRAISVIAWKAIASFDTVFITSDIKSLAMKTFLQLGGQKVDSSVRTLALNVLLENDPSVEELQQLLLYLTSPDKMYEVKKYLLQRLEQLSNTNKKFDEKYQEAVRREYRRVVNYNTFSQKGLSTAFTRSFLRSAGLNGSLVTIQEINSGLLKRGIVDVVLERESQKYVLFSLGLFAGGLGSFVSSSDQDENEASSENEAATAGMELSFLDVDIRPFVFFSGQGELMGHVWSGTASERTSAFQTTVNLHRHHEKIALGSGFMVEIDVEGAMSVDLAGQITLSLWSRNAQSLVEMQSGIVVQGSTKILTNFVQSRAEFILMLEPKLELATDVDFSGPVSLCMRLSQPETGVKQHIYKVERIPGSRHRLRKTRKITFFSPSRSHLLNRKTNEMCSKIFN